MSLVCLYDLRYHNDHHFYKQPESEAKTINKVELWQIQTCHFVLQDRINRNLCFVLSKMNSFIGHCLYKNLASLNQCEGIE